MIKEHASLAIAKTHRPYVPGNGIYVAVEATTYTGRLLQNWAREILPEGIEPDPLSEMHVTVVWSKAEPMNVTVNPDTIHKAFVESFEYWDGHDNDGYLVVKLFSSDLLALHQSWLDRGAQHSFPDYLIHVTLRHKFKPTDDMFERMLAANVQYRNHPLYFNHETLEGLKPQKD